ncbi:MAG: hypothetical protein M3Z66_24850 [Chloroflexota bacterium]|nr:hypothetical protein [Chloroflexota bacterium]
MIARHLASAHALLPVLEQPTPEMQRLCSLPTEDRRYPCRRTWERRLNAIPDTRPAQITCLGHRLMDHIQPFAEHGRAAALDRTILAARGRVWRRSWRW